VSVLATDARQKIELVLPKISIQINESKKDIFKYFTKIASTHDWPVLRTVQWTLTLLKDRIDSSHKKLSGTREEQIHIWKSNCKWKNKDGQFTLR